ncbi:DNA-binding protein [Actinoplanes sp. NPDC048988]|uniref:DNA-binding protein n=1 Tax=Actinoplanes sp. NPDC048988 TaxID=3363901 RepID=UPI0037216866
MDEILAAAEIADYLGVTRQRVAVLVDRADFPEPLAHLSVGRIWRTSNVRRWTSQRPHRIQEDEQK